MTRADRELMRAAATGEGLVQIGPGQLRDLAAAADATVRRFNAKFEEMTEAEAAFVRRLRVDDGYSWRAVAETCALEWGGDWGSNQLAGMAICERAAALHHEYFMQEPWN